MTETVTYGTVGARRGDPWATRPGQEHFSFRRAAKPPAPGEKSRAVGIARRVIYLRETWRRCATQAMSCLAGPPPVAVLPLTRSRRRSVVRVQSGRTSLVS